MFYFAKMASKKTLFKIDGVVLELSEKQLSNLERSLFYQLAQRKIDSVEEDGFILIDRQSTYVPWINKWLTNQEIPNSHYTLIHLLEEAQFYNLEQLADKIQQRLVELVSVQYNGTQTKLNKFNGT